MNVAASVPAFGTTASIHPPKQFDVPCTHTAACVIHGSIHDKPPTYDAAAPTPPNVNPGAGAIRGCRSAANAEMGRVTPP